MQIVSIGDSLHEMSVLFPGKNISDRWLVQFLPIVLTINASPDLKVIGHFSS